MFHIEKPLKEDKKIIVDQEEDEEEVIDETLEEIKQLPFLTMADYYQQLSLPSSIVSEEEKKQLVEKMTEIAVNEHLAGWYKLLMPKEYQDTATIDKLDSLYCQSISDLQKNIDSAIEAGSDSDAFNAKLEMVRKKLYCGADDAREAYEEVFPNVVGTSLRIDLLFSMLLFEIGQNVVSSSSNTLSPAIMSLLSTLEAKVESEGDWSRRNRLVAYKTILYLYFKKLDDVASFGVSCLATFTATELFSFDTFAHIVVIAAITRLPRPELKEKVLNSSDLIQTFQDHPVLHSLLTSYYSCNYSQFFKDFIRIWPIIKKNRYLSPFENFLYSELRLASYQQFLRSYLSVTLDSMAKLFGVSPAFIDKEISHFIQEGRLTCRIDAAEGIIEMVKEEPKATALSKVLQKGDVVTVKMQKLQQKLKNI